VHLAKILGACPSRAIPYKVREAMYWSELAAEKVKIKMHALIKEGRPLIPAEVTIRWQSGESGVPHATCVCRRLTGNDEGRSTSSSSSSLLGGLGEEGGLGVDDHSDDKDSDDVEEQDTPLIR
jgi:hypothetical protein